jgi:Cft2 family RNA processing exonuclease
LKIKVLGAAREVGGSCIEVATDRCKVALDYGIKLEGITDQYPKNFDAIIVSHAHLDHSGSLLRLAKSRNKQVIVSSKITRDATVELLKDMIKVNEFNGTSLGVDNQTVDQVKASWISTATLALEDMNIELYPAGHVAGAAMTSIHADGKSLLYTGDFCLHDTEILVGCNPQLLPKQPDVLISESTYGGTIRQQRSELIDQLYNEINYTIKHRGNVLIPTFAFHRSQEMAKRIDQAIENGTLPNCNVYMISKLANKITKIFNNYTDLFKPQMKNRAKPFEYKHVQEVERVSDIKEPAIVICTPGSDSPLKLAKDKHYIKIDGERYPVHAKIVQIELSGHADQLELIELITRLKPKQTVLVHGDLKEAEALSKQVSELTQVNIPEKNEEVSM